jgi:O-antigen/teichoic acid export membrane protein
MINIIEINRTIELNKLARRTSTLGGPFIFRGGAIGKCLGSNKHNRILKQTVLINFLSTIIPFVFVLICSGIIEKSYGQSFKGLAMLISAAVFSAIFSSISNVYAQAYTSIGKNWVMLIFRITRDLNIIVCFLILINYTSYSGAFALIISTVLLNLIFLIMMMLYYKRIRRLENFIPSNISEEIIDPI